jgi:hypothetical protein
LFNLFVKYRDLGLRIRSLEFLTHARPGFVYLGSKGALTLKILHAFDGQGFHTIFTPGARVYFHGCNIAYDEEGVAFLKEFGRIFLHLGGGSVAASTDEGSSWPGVTGIYHLLGRTVRVFISPGGEIERVDGAPPETLFKDPLPNAPTQSAGPNTSQPPPFLDPVPSHGILH